MLSRRVMGMSNLAEAWNQYYKQQLEKLQLEKVALEQNSPEEDNQ
jgi:hypothetical protein